MSRKNFTRIHILIDESGSMGHLGESTRKSVSDFITEQKNVEGEATISVSKFSDADKHVRFRSGDIKDVVAEITKEDYFPEQGGSTALADAICKDVDALGKELHNQREQSRPDKIIFVIVTDGGENASQEFRIDDAKKRIKLQEGTYNWSFVYLASGLQATVQGINLGFNLSNVASYSASGSGTQAAYSVISSVVTSSRMGVSRGISDAERKGLVDAGDQVAVASASLIADANKAA